jgi:hypothetical protein
MPSFATPNARAAGKQDRFDIDSERMTFIRRSDGFTQSLTDAKKSKTVLPEVRFILVCWYLYYDEHMKKIEHQKGGMLPRRTLYSKMGLYLDRVSIDAIRPAKGIETVTITAASAVKTENFQYCDMPIGMWSRAPCWALTPETIPGEIQSQPSLGPDKLTPAPRPSR